MAAGEESGAASPGVQEAGEPSAPTLQEILDSTSRFTQWRRMPMAHEYIDYLSFERVSKLLSTFARDQDAHLDSLLPFYGRIPLFSVGTPPSVVEQALRDYGTVGIVDSVRGEAKQIYRDEGHLSQQTFPDLHKVLTVFRLPGKIHEVKKAVFGQSFRPIAMDNIDEVPHAKGLPILLPNHDSVAHMIAASNQDRRAFLLPQPRNTFMVINPRTDDLVSFPSAENTAEINRVRNAYHSDTQAYGRALASLKWV
ncbi:Aspartyl aminopeptidase [Pseudozyma hubeiensis]|nr:Aspartyl aminopeptidase [Pseudozyma hubeiensis]